MNECQVVTRRIRKQNTPEHARDVPRYSKHQKQGNQIFGQIWDIKTLETNTKGSGSRWKPKGSGHGNRNRSKAREAG